MNKITAFLLILCINISAADRPNIVLIITDDQGYGDVGIHGNPQIKTPHLDALAKESARFTRFYVSPVCSPTRASLLTGRYNYRTGVVDTYRGRSMMHGDEITLAEALRDNGYRTGIFGKWHLGDNYPLRALDQGFETALVCSGGGITQPSDPPDNHYFDPILKQNGKEKKFTGYCTDIFFDHALKFIERHKREPFFTYIATNAPHTPLEVADELVAPYLAAGLDETTARVYAMVTNIDTNIGRLLQTLDKLKLAENTLLIFMTDNGAQQKRYNAGKRGQKGSVYEGGVCVPFFLRWPARIKTGREVDKVAAHIDVLPTLLEITGTPRPDKKIDGRSFLSLLNDPQAAWPERNLFIQWHRGDEPEAFRGCAVRNDRYKLVDGKELYDLQSDPAESKNIAAENAPLVAQLRHAYEAWLKDVATPRGYAPPRIVVGTKHENPVTLTRQDWRGGDWTPTALGHWEISVPQTGKFDITLRFTPLKNASPVSLQFGGTLGKAIVDAGKTNIRFSGIELSAGDGKLEAWIEVDGKPIGVNYVDVKWVD